MMSLQQKRQQLIEAEQQRKERLAAEKKKRLVSECFPINLFLLSLVSTASKLGMLFL